MYIYATVSPAREGVWCLAVRLSIPDVTSRCPSFCQEKPDRSLSERGRITEVILSLQGTRRQEKHKM